MRLFFAPLLLAAMLSACAVEAQQPTKSHSTKQKAKQMKPKTAAKASVAAEPVIVFRRTPCYGTCPHYEATIYPDGRVQYEGLQYAPVEGKREFKLPMAVVNRIRQDADQMGFFQMKERYPTRFTDMPSTFLTIRRPDGTMKLVQAEDNIPPSLQKLFDYIHAEIVKGLGAPK